MRAVWRCIRHSNGALEQVGGRHTPFACAPRDLLTYAWSRPRHSMPRAPCPRRATPSDQPSARAPSQRAYLAFSPDPPTNDRAGALPTTEPVSCRPTRVPHAHSPCAAHPEPARRQRRATCAHPWTVLTRPCDRRTGAPMFPGADGDRGPPGWPPREAALHDSPPPLREPALRERRRCMSQHCRCPSAPGAQSVVLLSGRHEARASVLEQRRVSCVENGVGLGHAVVRVS